MWRTESQKKKEVVVNKSDVVQKVADRADVTRQEVEKVVEAFFHTVRAAVGDGDRVAWPSFGSFSATQRQARTGRNPRTGEAVAIPASRAVKFSASTALKSALNPAPAKKTGKKSAPAAKKSAAPAKKSPAVSAKKAPAANKSESAAKAPAAKASAKKAVKKK
jgi:DNA-binding protein HU-beta